jgi:hypothetical protein
LAALTLVACVVLFWGLGRPYLWQDEAATAVLGERLLRFGKPLGYDGRNLITMDQAVKGDPAAPSNLASDADAALAYFVARGDFREDTTWIGQPWGQFVASGLSLAAFGKSTVAARAPFAAASVLTVVAVFLLARLALRRRLVAILTAGMLLANAYWILHGRQCRYYALSGLFEVLTVAAFVRWQREGRWAGACLVASAWCWFQCDFGAFWPGTAVLLAVSALTGRPGWRASARAGAAIAASVAPFCVYYRLWDRLKVPWEAWTKRMFGLLFTWNQFVVPLVVLAVVLLVLVRCWRTLEPRAAGLLAACSGIVLIAVPWSTLTAPSHFHRYIVHATPLACLLVAWGLTEGGARLARAASREGLGPVAAIAAAAFVSLSPLASNLVSVAIPVNRTELHPLGTWIRPEIGIAWRAVFEERLDPNREAIEIVKARAKPEDEILVTYEDIPFMFYTDNRIRGGIPAFRVLDPTPPPPRFLVARPSVLLVDQAVFLEASRRSEWRRLPTKAPDVSAGNNPDPRAQWYWLRSDLPKIVVAERIGSAP